MINIFWQYTVKPEHTDEFRAVYGPEGDWATLFASDPAYHGTTLLQQCGEPRICLTIDRWESEQAFMRFKQACADAYARIDASCEAFTESETYLGSYEGISHESL